MRKKLLLFALVCLLVAPLSVAAATATSTKAKVKEATSTAAKVEAIKKAVKGAIARCPIIESKIQVKIADFDNSKIKHLTVYNNLKDRISKIADRLTARGVDVTALRATLVVLDQKIAKFNADYAIYVAKLKASQEGVCGKSEAQFKALLKETKVALVQVHKDAADIRDYVATTIKAEINKIRISLKTPATSTTSTIVSTSTSLKLKSTSTVEKKDDSKKVKPIVPLLPKLD
ncbi:MAG: hypothetical protein WCT26_00925 [Candidatus Buchananbacteria bacterium]|jgi:hypothetical protein